MFDWGLIISVALGSTIGAEMGRRRLERAGKIYCFLPLWLQRILTSCVAVSGLCFLESARIALADPGQHTVWMLIGTAAATIILLAVHTIWELNVAKRRVQGMENC